MKQKKAFSIIYKSPENPTKMGEIKTNHSNRLNTVLHGLDQSQSEFFNKHDSRMAVNISRTRYVQEELGR
jgi:hypothetical protein